MSLTVYKVIFKGNNETKEKNLTLTFKSVIYEEPIKIPAKFILGLKKLSEINKNIVFFKNIDEITQFDQDISLISYNYYYILLFQLKNEKTGFLIGNTKKMGDILIGIWPFNREQTQISTEKIYEKLDNIISKAHEYSKICLIN